MNIKLRIKKDGTPYKNDLVKAREVVKSNFSNIAPDELPKALRGYYNIVKSARERVIVRDPKTGKALGGKLRKVVLDELKTASEASGISERELLKKENYKFIYDSAISQKVGFSGTDAAIDQYLRLGYSYGIQINDGDGLIQMKVEEVYFLISQIKQYLIEYGFFTVFFKGEVNASGKVTLNIPRELIEMVEGDKKTSTEDLMELLNNSDLGIVAIASR